MVEYIELIIACIFVNNILLAQFLGNCPFLGTSKKMEGNRSSGPSFLRITDDCQRSPAAGIR